MSRNYGNVAKKIWRVKYVYQHHAYDNYKAEYVKVGAFPQKIWCYCKAAFTLIYVLMVYISLICISFIYH